MDIGLRRPTSNEMSIRHCLSIEYCQQLGIKFSLNRRHSHTVASRDLIILMTGFYQMSIFIISLYKLETDSGRLMNRFLISLFGWPKSLPQTPMIPFS